MSLVTPSDAASYAGSVLGYCLVLVFVAAIPYGIGVLVVSGPGGGGGSLIFYALLQVLAYGILLAGVVGLLYKVVADGVALATAETDDNAPVDDPQV